MTSDRARPRLLPQRGRGRVRQLIARRRMVAAVLVGVAAAGLPSPVIASSGGGRRITDAENTRTVYLVVAALVLLALALAVFTWWFWRSTRREHEALAPLEVMSDRKFVTSDSLTRQVLLDGNRPVGAAPLAPGAPEPLILPVDDEPASPADDEPATTVIAGDAGEADGDGALDVDEVAEVEVATGRTEAPVAADGEPPTVVDADASAEATDEPADVLEAADGPAAQAPPTSSDADDVHPPTNGSAPVPIDPGLPVPQAEVEPVRHLSLAELVALEAHAPLGFDDDELASTPSTGIPVIESAEAWVERQLVGSNGQAVNGTPDGEHGDELEVGDGDDPAEPTVAVVRTAE
jgi:hypothetical protein